MAKVKLNDYRQSSIKIGPADSVTSELDETVDCQLDDTEECEFLLGEEVPQLTNLIATLDWLLANWDGINDDVFEGFREYARKNFGHVEEWREMSVSEFIDWMKYGAVNVLRDKLKAKLAEKIRRNEMSARCLGAARRVGGLAPLLTKPQMNARIGRVLQAAQGLSYDALASPPRSARSA
jgi:hypothetical protein